jgi:protein-L-isoaspartate(D-aspartate) O-methyltransferase
MTAWRHTSSPGFQRLREDMVEDQLAARGIRDLRVLDAMREVPRERFVPSELLHHAYADGPLPIGEGQTISQPFVVALMIEALELTAADRALDIGTGSGYAAAVKCRPAAEVYTVERHRNLADSARQRCEELGYDNIEVLYADGTLGWPEHAPYDAIVVGAGGPSVPRSLRQQLAIGGRLVIPIGASEHTQELVRVRRRGEEDFVEDGLGGVRFVPLLGAEGWHGPDPDPTPVPPGRKGREP